MRHDLDNSEDVIDSRHVIQRIADLELIAEPDDDEKEELAALKALESEAEGYASDWKYGATLVRDSYFKEYAMELAEEIGAINSDASWPNDCIDWDKACRELKMDYTAVDFSGVTYWVR